MEDNTNWQLVAVDLQEQLAQETANLRGQLALARARVRVLEEQAHAQDAEKQAPEVEEA